MRTTGTGDSCCVNICDLTNKVAIVTGAGQGIGQAIALTLARHGATIVAADLNTVTVNQTRELVEKEYGTKAFSYRLDVCSYEQCTAMVDSVISTAGQVDILVNDAGVANGKPFLETSIDEFEKILSVNLKGVYNCCRALLPYFLEMNRGIIVNIASIAGKRGGGVFGNTLYAASKAGVIGLTKGLAREFGPTGININAVCPGPTDTTMLKDFKGERRTRFLNTIPLRRFAKPSDIANAVLFLCSPLANYIHGEIMDVDGGIMLD